MVMETEVKNIPIEQLAEKYQEFGSVWKVGEFFGISGQSVYEKLKKAGFINTMNVFSEEDKKVLLEKYTGYRERGELQKLADELGRTKQFICRKAKELGLTGGHIKYNFSEEKRKELSEQAKEKIRKYGHPRGAKGLVHTKESRAKMSEASKRYWEENYDELHSETERRRRSDLTMKMVASGIMGIRSRSLIERVDVGGKTFVIKSSWEYDIALYLEYLKCNRLINEWEYEPITFVFKYNTLGVRSYKPDFSVTRDDRVYYIEVKGWPDKKYEIKRKLMDEEFPEIRMIYITKGQYFSIERKHSSELTGWASFREKAGSAKKVCAIEGCNNPVHSKGLCRHHFYEKYKR